MRWGTPVPQAGSGVYVVALTQAMDRLEGQQAVCPVSSEAVVELLDRRPELLLDGSRPSVSDLRRRIAALWLPDEVVLYVGRAGTSLRSRVRQYYTTPVGARRPHAGGWPLKMLSNLCELWVHYSACENTETVEQEMLGVFQRSVSGSTRAVLHDPQMPIPFANLESRKGERKRHGIEAHGNPSFARTDDNRAPDAT